MSGAHPAGRPPRPGVAGQNGRRVPTDCHPPGGCRPTTPGPASDHRLGCEQENDGRYAGFPWSGFAGQPALPQVQLSAGSDGSAVTRQTETTSRRVSVTTPIWDHARCPGTRPRTRARSA